MTYPGNTTKSLERARNRMNQCEFNNAFGEEKYKWARWVIPAIVVLGIASVILTR